MSNAAGNPYSPLGVTASNGNATACRHSDIEAVAAAFDSANGSTNDTRKISRESRIFVIELSDRSVPFGYEALDPRRTPLRWSRLTVVDRRQHRHRTLLDLSLSRRNAEGTEKEKDLCELISSSEICRRNAPAWAQD
ncbi:hypothetical protein BIW11_03220 [Tropilaelaps mercedesae]|uniref:Uncharacterized protein n=1 Tax=Tropilaelaps mercedesae TaxID=418985 RepID=A0A1V9XQ88_9ACAR|nr:hypothetical protein BIW11_03220 [Tropilaelaps mercedesae]